MKRQKKCNGSTEGEELRRKKKESKRKKVKSFTNCWGRPGADNLFLGLRHMEAEQLQGSQSLKEAPRYQLRLKERCF